MHGIIYQQLQQYVNKKFGPQEWSNLLKDAGLSGKMYLPTQTFPDEDAVSLIKAIQKKTSLPLSLILENFGEFIAPGLLKIYSAMVKPEWKTLDLLEHVEGTMHKAVRFADKTATPPALVCKREAINMVSIRYNSQRKLVDLGIGIIKAIAKHYNERIQIHRTDYGDVTKLEIVTV